MNPFLKLLILIFYILLGVFISQFVAMASLYPFLGDGVLRLGDIVANPAQFPEYKNYLLYIQAVTSTGSLIVPSWIYIAQYEKYVLRKNLVTINEMLFLCTVIIVIVFMPINAYVVELNMQMKLPEMLREIETWMQGKENELKVLTDYLTNFESTYQFCFGLIVIALIPAVGEELVFRGAFQNILFQIFKNKHFAIWASAFVFSAIHLQFYGFFPRMLLGAIFGYLYFWSGSLYIPILGHFVNNGFTLFLLHLKNIKKINIDLESTQDISYTHLGVAGVLFIATMILFNIFSKKANHKFY